MILSEYKTVTPINKGWSKDKKYCVIKEDGTKQLLRVTTTDQFEKKKKEHDLMKQVATTGVPMCHAIEVGFCEEGVYSLQSWIEGKDAESVIASYSGAEEYAYGRKAGEILNKIHSIPAPSSQEDWEICFNRKLDKKIKAYQECPIQYDGGDALLSYIEANRYLLKGRPQCFQHGDYHIGNMMFQKDQLTIIDFDRFDFGDPWEEFNRIVWCAQKSPLFATGMVNGYFDGTPTIEFWRLLALYIASNTLSSIYWAIPFGQDEINTMLNQAKEVLIWYDNMQNPVPSWYKKESV